MRRVALACAVLLVVLALFRLGGRAARARAPAFSPAATEERATAEGERGGAGGPAGRGRVAAPLVELRAGGVILLDGKAVSLRALHKACAGKATIALRVDDEASWAHVEWVLAALQGAGVRRIRFDLPGGAVESCFDSAYWERDARHVVGGHTAGILSVASDEMSDPGLERRVAKEAARIERECRLRPLGMVFASRVDETWPSFGLMARGLRAFDDAGVEIELRFASSIDGEVPDVAPLPPPAELWFSLVEPWPRCACRPGIAATDLPAADMGQQDADLEEDDRLILNLDRGGRMFWRKELSLDELATALQNAKDRYHLKMKEKGETGFEKDEDGTLFSKLYVLIRADRAAPAWHVGWILHVLAEQNFYKVQFALAAGSGAAEGPCVRALDERKLQLFLPTDGVSGIAGRDEPSVHVYVDPQSLGAGAIGGLDAEGLCRSVRQAAEAARADPERKFVAGVHVVPGVAWERVVGAVNEIARAGIWKTVFVDLPAPDAATRQSNPLPR